MLTKENLQALKSKATELPHVKAQGRGSWAISVVHHKNGKRVVLTPALYEELGSPEKVQFSIVADERVLLIGKELGMSNRYPVRTKNKPTVYKASLTAQIADVFQLDFTEKSSMTFSDVAVDSLDEGAKIAAVKMKVDAEVDYAEVDHVDVDHTDD